MIFSISSFGQKKNEGRSKHYIPRNLNECLIQLDNIISDSMKQDIKKYSENEFVGLTHLTLGMYLRNKWGLWQESRLAAYFYNIGVYHPDEMSGIILTSYYRKIKGEPINFIDQINPIRMHYSLPIITDNTTFKQDSLMGFIPKYQPYNKVTHNIKCDLGARYVDYEGLNFLLNNNGFPKVNSPNFYVSMGYLGNYKKIFWFIGGGLYSDQEIKEGVNKIEGMGLDYIKIGSGLAIYRGQFIGIISTLNYGFSSFNYSLSTTDGSSFIFEGNNKTKHEIKYISHYLNPNVNIYYNLVPNYNKAIGINLGYNFNLNNQENIKVNGLEISLSLIIEVPE
jgi:hypothetical protein